MRRSLGREAEAAARAHLESKGFRILRSNYRTQEGEVDIIAQKGRLLVFVEVKGTAKLDLDPAERVDRGKRGRMLAVAERFLAENPWDGDVRFDLVLVSPHGVVHLEDAFRG